MSNDTPKRADIGVPLKRLVMRRRSQMFLRDGRITCSHCIEVKHAGRWQFMGDDSGIYRFSSSAERDAKMAEMGEPHNAELSEQRDNNKI